MKKEHKTMSVVGALIVVVLIGFFYSRSKKEGMASDSAKNIRNRQGQSSGTFVPSTLFEHTVHFFSMVWLIDLFNSLTGQQKKQVIARAQAGGAARGSPAARNLAASRAAAERARRGIAAAAARGPATRGPATRGAGAAGRESFANRGRVQRGGNWRPLGSIAPM